MATSPQKQAKNDQDMGGDDDDDNEDDLESAELLPSYQILLSLISLTTKIEASMELSLNKSAKVLKELSEFVLGVSKRETRQVIQRKVLTQSLFQLYQSAMTKTATTAKQQSMQELVLKDCMVNYTELVVELFDGPYEELIKEGRVYIQVLMAAGTSSYAFLACMALLAKATGDLRL